MKTMGVIGGLGPQATMDFEQRVHKVCQEIASGKGNVGYPPMVVYYHRFPPVLVNEDFTPIMPMQPDPRLFEAVKKLGSWADFIVITSNAPHLFQQQIEEATGLKVLSMIDLTLGEVQKRQIKKVGVIGMGEPRVYQMPLDRMSIPHVTITKELRDRLDKSILSLMAGAEGPQEQATAQEAVAALREQDADGIILGCTEIPLLLREYGVAPDLINPAELLAEAAVRYAMA